MAIAQNVMRHSDIRLTAEVHTNEGRLPLSTAMNALPSLGARANSPTTAQAV